MQQKFMLFQSEAFSIQNHQFKQYFQNGRWMLSQLFNNQSYENFQSTIHAFFQTVKQIKNQPSINTQQIQIQNLNFLIQAKDDFYINEFHIKNIAEKLQISVQIVEITLIQNTPKTRSLGDQNLQQAKIIVQKQLFSKNISFIFGLQLQKNQINAPNQIKKPDYTYTKPQQPPQISSNPKMNTIQIPFRPDQLPKDQERNQKERKKLLKIKINDDCEIFCEICNELYKAIPENQIKLPCCDKIVHNKCTLNEIQTSREFLINFHCFFCKQPIEISFVKANISQQILQETARNKVKLTQCFETCYNCKGQIQILNYQKNTSCQIQCNNCQTLICSRCLKNYHEQDVLCHDLLLEIKTSFQGQPDQATIICPNCNLFQIKDDGCDHVTCGNCKMDLCSECSVDRKPILIHGNHFHRKGCKHYAAIKGKELMTSEKKRDCILCKNSPDGECHFPIDLQTYKQQKQY